MVMHLVANVVPNQHHNRAGELLIGAAKVPPASMDKAAAPAPSLSDDLALASTYMDLHEFMRAATVLRNTAQSRTLTAREEFVKLYCTYLVLQRLTLLTLPPATAFSLLSA